MKPLSFSRAHTLTLAKSLQAVMTAANRLMNRCGVFPVKQWILDSGSFTRVSSGGGHMEVPK